MRKADPNASRRRDPIARAIVARFRELCRSVQSDERVPGKGDAGVIVACSGGADSSALALAIGTAKAIGPVTLAHVRHDARPETETLEDAQAVSRLAETLGVSFEQAYVKAGIRPSEARYRTLRYAELDRIAAARSAGAIATGHHADDQLETLVMAIARGAGVRGMRGIAPTRRLRSGVRVVRPMLEIRRSDAQGLCRRAGIGWRNDPTNTDADSNLRAAIRARVTEPLLELKPAASRNAARHAAIMREVGDLLNRAAQETRAEVTRTADGCLDRCALRNQLPATIAELLRREILKAGARPDRVSSKKTHSVVRAVCSNSGEAKTFEFGEGVAVRVHADTVEISSCRC